MPPIAKRTFAADLEKEMRQSYLDYAMSVIVGRALPDVRDGLKPVHRRILYAMKDLGNDWNKPYKKSARITGDVIGKYHPHGDSAIYHAIVRMAQDFSMRYPLIDGQGNFGSIDGDSAAAMRYTEVRLSKIAHELLADIDKETVDFGPNYDETEEQPLVFPTRLPNLLLNGSEGIAVGMATKVPPHNLTETISACQALLRNPDISVASLMEHLPGPDFPTAGIINGNAGIIEAYNTGQGSIRLRGKVDIDSAEESSKDTLIVSELPYQVSKAKLIEKIAMLAKAGVIEGISNIRDESDKAGLRIVIELKSSANAQVVENNLYNKTALESSYGINLVAIDNNQPKRFDLKALLNGFLRHRREVITRKLVYELRKAEERAHILEGQTIALSNLDEMIAIIRSSNRTAQAKERLMEKTWKSDIVIEMLGPQAVERELDPGNIKKSGLFHDGYRLSDTQASAILQMRLQNLTALEQEKVFEEYSQILKQIERTQEILNSPQLLIAEVSNELTEMVEVYGKGDARRTRINEFAIDITDESLIDSEDVVVTISHEGYAKQQPVSEYRAQNRGGKGKTGTALKTDDFVKTMFIANTHNTLLCFTNQGKVYWTKVYNLKRASRNARGEPLVNRLSLTGDEKVTAVLPIRSDDSGKYVFMATRRGRVKKCEVDQFSRPRSNGIRAISFNHNDELVNVAFTDGSSDILLVSNVGRMVRFDENQVRHMGRQAAGVKGMKLKDTECVIAMMCIRSDEADLEALLVSSDGFGKRTKVQEFPKKSRATKGVVVLPSHKRGKIDMVGTLLVNPTDEIMLITQDGTLIRTPVDAISTFSRSAAGVKLIGLDDNAHLVGVAAVSVGDSQDDDGQICEQDESDPSTGLPLEK